MSVKLGQERHALDDHISLRTVGFVGREVFDLGDRAHAIDHFAKDGVLPVQPRSATLQLVLLALLRRVVPLTLSCYII